VSVLLHLDSAWQVIHAMGYQRNTTIKMLANNHPSHNPDMKRIDFCQYFKFPETVECASDTIENIVSSKSCVIVVDSWNRWANNSHDYHLPRHTLRKENIDICNEECVAGLLQSHSTCGGFMYNESTLQEYNPKSLFYYMDFQLYYINIFEMAKEVLHIHLNDMVVIHWRRGDQKNRCRADCRYRDYSINCANVTTFMNKIELSVKSIVPKSSIIYIATNEENKKDLNELERANLSTMRTLHHKLKRHKGIKLATSMDTFILELLFMCQAKYFFAAGVSSVHFFIKSCRARYQLLDNNHTFFSSVSNYSSEVW
jgi:hypothetical protein